ncbi:MAG: DNA polymerase II [Euryarchaeota archaeon]|nr:DNA polymerase II [Euryarchaeota archaeon]
MRGFIVHPTYEIKGNNVFVKLYGRLENGESFLCLKRYRPYFFIREKDLHSALEAITVDYEKTDLVNFAGERAVKVYTDIPIDVRKNRKKLRKEEIECYEADVKFVYRFLFDKGIYAVIDIKGDYREGKRVDRVYKDPDITPSEGEIPLKTISVDIEVDEETDEVICVSLYDEDRSKSFIIKKNIEGAEYCSNEKELLIGVKEYIIKKDPDIITGWNVIDFDFEYLKKRFSERNISFDFGRSEKKTRFRTQSSFIRSSRVKIDGRMVLDAMYMVRDFAAKLADYKLDTAASEILNEGKIEITKDMHKLFEKNPEKLIKYNKKDAELVYRINEEKKLIEFTKKMAGVTGLQLDRVKGSIASLDSLYLRKARKMGIVCPSVSGGQKKHVVGGLVREPQYGIYNNVLVLDFRSLYPSIIATMNIDPLTFTEKKTEIKAPNDVYFTDEEAILPKIILELLEKRKRVKHIYEEQYAIKIVMNSFFGVLGNPSCRFYNPKIANAITAFGRFFLDLTAEKSENMGYEVIYGDTDSIFVVSKAKTREEAEKIGKEIEKRINEFYEFYVTEEYGQKNYLMLEFEKLYEKFYLPKQRNVERGAKKRYAGLIGEELDIVGLEYVRRDWTELAREFQYNLLTKVFADEDYESYIKETVEKLKAGKLDSQLVYTKGVRKDLSAYTKTTPPHVKAARKLDTFNDRVIKYVVAKTGPEPIEHMEKARIDYNHYIEKQLRPIADSVLTFFDTSFEEIITGKEQAGLEDFL